MSDKNEREYSAPNTEENYSDIQESAEESAQTEVESEIETDGDEEETQEEKKKKAKRELYDWAQATVFSVVAIVLFFSFVIRVIGVDGHSMENTLQHNDRIAISNLFYTPAQGDIVVLRKESFGEKPLVKRVIATEGQIVDIDFVRNEVYVDGVLLDEPYIKEPTRTQKDVEFPIEVPEGCIFVMGDNRNNSLDSRYGEIGMVDARCVIGKLLFRVFPFDALGGVD